MARPRFHKLPPEQQQTIERAALAEFVDHGLNAASLNRIIDAAGISKGSMYYYFDGKEDLYAHVAAAELGRLFAEAGPFPVPVVADAEAYWSTLESYYVRVMTALAASPQRAALARDWLAASSNPSVHQAQKEIEASAMPWFEAALVAGQKVRAVRKDAPLALLLAIVFSMGQAMDAWLVSQPLDEKALRKHLRLLIGMVRRALAP